MKTVTILLLLEPYVIKKGTEKHLEKIPRSSKLTKMQKIALTGIANILMKTLSM